MRFWRSQTGKRLIPDLAIRWTGTGRKEKIGKGRVSMLIYAIDDEESMLRMLHQAIAEAAPDAGIRDFLLGADALQALREGGERPDVVFSDIEMPPPTGVEVAAELRTISPQTKVVFVTGFPQYAVEAYQLHVQGYIMKPVRAGRVREELLLMGLPGRKATERLSVQCFGYFEVFWRGEPLSFSRSKTKELFAFLIDREGCSCYAEEVIAALFENTRPEDLRRSKQNLRNLISDLKSVLTRIGQQDVLIRRGSTLAIRPELVECDYYQMRKGDLQAMSRFRGAYMDQYSWAELTKGDLSFRM